MLFAVEQKISPAWLLAKQAGMSEQASPSDKRGSLFRRHNLNAFCGRAKNFACLTKG